MSTNDRRAIASEQHLPYRSTADVVVLDGDGSRWTRERTCWLVKDEDGRSVCSWCGFAALFLSDVAYCPVCGCEIQGGSK
jgi:hypothetical protein